MSGVSTRRSIFLQEKTASTLKNDLTIAVSEDSDHLPQRSVASSSRHSVASIVPACRVSHDSLRAQTCTFEGPGASNTTKIPRQDHQRKREKERKWEREREKKREHMGPPTLRGPTLRGRNLRGPTLRGSTPLGPHPFGAPPFTKPKPPSPGPPTQRAKNETTRNVPLSEISDAPTKSGPSPPELAEPESVFNGLGLTRS